MKISESCLSFNAQHSRQLQQVSERTNANTTDNPSITDSGSDTRIFLNSNQWQSINLYSSDGTTTYQQQLSEQTQFTRFYNSKVVFNELSENATTGIVTSSFYHRYQESQFTQVTINGTVQTCDDEAIQFQFSASSGSNFILELGQGEYAERISGRTDPLIINYGGGFNNLSDQAYAFDQNSDGVDEMVSFTGTGSGFLAWDKNGDGIINSGSELFGAESGDGFAELAALDEDRNGFIDSGDSVFSQLQIFEKDSEGNDALRKLTDFDIAAISVESVATPFRITDHLNQERGMARATGIFIRNDGSVGSTQQIDLTNRDPLAEQRLERAFAAPSDSVPEEEAPDNRDLDNLMQQINIARQSRLDRQQELANQDDNDRPKTLLEQLVDQLEEYTAAQRSQRKED
ncbi:MAG: hypothetical protein D9N11_11810 [Ketobacter sp.]|nr:MAG: hypothetical protein D9N11_11810 [Ketobacter sp.]